MKNDLYALWEAGHIAHLQYPRGDQREISAAMSKPKYDSTVARIAGNIASGLVGRADAFNQTTLATEVAELVQMSVLLARGIVNETKRTEPSESDDAVAAPPVASNG